MPDTDYTLVGLLVAAVAGLFGALKLSNDRTVKAVEATVEAVKASCADKDREIAWLRVKLDDWTRIGQSAISAAEKITETRKP